MVTSQPSDQTALQAIQTKGLKMQHSFRMRELMERHPELTRRPSDMTPGDSYCITGENFTDPTRNATLFTVRIRKREPREYYHVQGVSIRRPRGRLYNRVRYVVTGTQYNVCRWDWESDAIDVLHITPSSRVARAELRKAAGVPVNAPLTKPLQYI